MVSTRKQVEQQLYSVPESATYLGASEKAVWQWVYERIIESVKIGRLRKIRKSELDRFIADNTVPVRRVS